MTLSSSENRAVAPVWSEPSSTVLPVSAAPTPTPIPRRHPNAMPDSAVPDGKSRTLQGPSAKEWARHRETIIGLYRQYPLKRVSEIMKRNYGFTASKRMYDKRFREWNVFKNANSDERARASRRAECSTSAMDQGGSQNFSQEDLRKTIKCARTIQQGVRRPPPPASPATSSGASPAGTETAAPPYHNRQARRSISISDLIKEEDDPDCTAAPPFSPFPPHEKFPQAIFSPPISPAGTPNSGSGSSDEMLQGRHNSGALVVPAPSSSPGPSLAAYRAQLHDLFRTPPPSMSPDARTRTMSLIHMKLLEYYDWQLNNVPQGVLPDDYLGNRSSDESIKYWNTVKNALYLVKISTGSMEDPTQRPDRQALPALAEAGRLAAPAMTSHPFDFLRNLFATLSPANTSARPELRGILLRFLASEAQSNLSPNHPITQICKELQRDEGCQEISQHSLQCMLEIFNSRLGRSRAITFKLLDSLATLLRRSGEYHAGLEIITELLKSARPVFGPESDQVRTVENELAHFYMLSGDSELALGHCLSVVTRPPPHSACPGSQEEPAFYQDGIAAHAMEDIAEIHQRRGDMEQCITWLERAASIALMVWGPKSVATSHLIDKMTSLQRQYGKDLLRSATLWEAAMV
ncbi:hypothetical protein C8A03DRAFT_32709 [Achaetomium macrosporum]|uniref:Clr5 domain-containing protein n=1 Tax=Achaetomium macrosporum TaxID=79813 RepID=A0AAN7CDG4_9PEZI|nr:hypothetical protein C8A03DRAFT_32709 [Achaetomium macrosporum]